MQPIRACAQTLEAEMREAMENSRIHVEDDHP
jgi:hypothetical protein